MFMNKKLKALWDRFQAWREARREAALLKEIARHVPPEDAGKPLSDSNNQLRVIYINGLGDFAKNIESIEAATYHGCDGRPVEFAKKTIYKNGSEDFIHIATHEEVAKNIKAVGIQTQDRLGERCSECNRPKV